MDFINKLIKKGIFGLALCFSFFVFFGGMKISAAADCTIKINDGDKYLVLNTDIDWSDSGVTIFCDSIKQENVSVSINEGTPIVTNDSGRDVSKSYLNNAGFYKIKYFLTSDSTVSITRQVRVLPSNLNEVRNVWVGNFDENTAGNDEFVKVVSNDAGYLVVGNFGTSAYVVSFNSLGEYKWHSNYANTVISDIVDSGITGVKNYFIVGQNVDNKKGFIQSVGINADDTGLVENASSIELSDTEPSNNVSFVNRVTVSSNYVYIAGYLTNADGSKTGKLVRLTKAGALLQNVVYFTNSLESEYKSVTTVQSDGLKVVAVGATSVSDHSGATGGLVTVCDEGLTTCSNQNPYFWQNSSGASTTTTTFNDVASLGDKYLIVGKSRVDRVSGVNTTNNAGAEDSLYVLLNSDFSVADAILSGTSSADEIYSLTEINSNKFVAVGKKASQGLYSYVALNEGALTVEENVISGKNGSVELRSAFVRKNSNEEVNFVFVGTTQATVVENIIVGENKGAKDAVLVIVDNTNFSNYGDINILQYSAICNGGLTSCPADQMLEDYRLQYGTIKVVLSSANDISSANLGTFLSYHSFVNNQGVKFILGRSIIVSANPVAPDISSDTMGIDKWYLYSRPQNIGANVGLKERAELWTTRYMPVDNNLTKTAGTTYYIISGGNFVEDTSSRDYTYSNYVKLEDEPQTSSAAFQSVEKAKEFALLQEFARVAFVQKKYNYDSTGINSFQGETANLATQNYYFIYYIDLSITNATGCGTNNGALYGTCTEYTGYAFASLTRVKEIAKLIVEKYNSFVSESNTRFNPNGSVSLPQTAYFKEEMSTMKYMQSITINLTDNLYLETTYYPILKNAANDYSFSVTSEVTNVTGKSSVVFANTTTADYKNEGKYSVRYCYNYGKANQNCGASTTFVIDRTAPIVNYNLTNGNTGVINSSTSSTNPLLISTSMLVNKITDIDPYAYTLISGKKYYLQCNALINSDNCIANLAEYVNKSYSYKNDDPNKLYNITVYDRAGNNVSAYFKVGTVMPKVSVNDGAKDESFVLTVEFFNRNDIDSFTVAYTRSEECSACADGSEISNKILLYVNALIYNNYLELEKAANDPAYEPNVIYSINLTFSLSRTNADGSIAGGLVIPKIDVTEDEKGNRIYTFVENENELLPISKGLYKFTLGDNFHNISEAFGGIGLDKAELYVYVNEDDDAVETVDSVMGKFPITRAEAGDIIPPQALLVKNPSTYEYVGQLPSDLLNDYNSNMFFTKKYVYVTFKKSEFGIIRISKANSLNAAGGYGISEESNLKLSCLFKIYGSQVPLGDVGECDGGSTNDLIPLENISSYIDYLNAQGIYIISEKNGYYHMAFTVEGTYDIWSEVYVNITNSEGVTNEWTAIPVFYSFTIDATAPVVEFEVVCSTSPCVAEKDSFDSSDFVNNVYKVNIGNYDMKLYINKDILTGGAINRLLVAVINGEVHNAYSYSLANSDSTNGNYITFAETGTYTVIFYDGAGNEVTYTFIIDKTPPTIDKIEDINGKNFGSYQQYVDVEFVVNEGSFLENNIDKNMIVFQYRIDSGDIQEISVKSTVDGCVISTGNYQSGTCTIEELNGVKGLRLSFVIAINKDAANRDVKKVVQTLNISVTDYFGNKRTETQDFMFDNLSPYTYFSSEYTPILDFGENVSNEEREKMLSTGANSELGIFDCSNGVRFTVGQTEVEKQILHCGDTPEMEDVNNGVIVETYEAYRVSYNNYKKNADNTYSLMTNGTYLSVTDTVYKKRFMSFANAASLESKIGTMDIYSKGAFVKVTNKESIDPNIQYYDENGNNPVSIKDMYVRVDDFYNTCNSTTNRQCLLYKMYTEKGTFEENQDFYVYDTNEYTVVTNLGEIVLGDYSNYYYDSGMYKADNGKYLSALTLENTCIKVNGSACTPVEAGRIKVKSYDSNTFIYYNLINAMSGETNSNIVKLTMSDSSVKSAIMDNRIWQIAVDGTGAQVRFGFGLASNLGRPIIFVARDGAGNVASNYLETVIAIRDSIAPEVSRVLYNNYYKDETAGTTKDNYIKSEVYHKLYNVDNVTCANNISDFYTLDEGTGDYVKVENCSDLANDKQYYLKLNVYEPVADDQEKTSGVDYYRANRDDLGTNYLTSKDLIIEFNEPIYRIECSFYVYNGDTGESFEKNCYIHNAEFDYSEERKVFELIYQPLFGETNYFVNYKVIVYDFSNNSKTVNSLFIDRETPNIKFNDNVSNEDRLETDYVNDTDKSVYNENYLTDGFKSETTSTDSINNRISSVGATNIVNNFAYEVVYYQFNYNLTYKNYILTNGTPASAMEQPDGVTKDPSLTYYVLVKKPSNYVLKGNAGCIDVGGEDYCYVVDDYNYYPALLENNAYWTEVSEENYYIKNSTVGVYKIEYRVIDHSGNVSSTLIKTVYCHDTTAPVINVNGENTTNKYGYHSLAMIAFENEKQAVLYSYKCKDGVTTCELPTEIFAKATSELELVQDNITGSKSYKYDEESIYKIYFHDRGNYVASVNGAGETIMVLQYNALDYTFLIDTTSPELYLNAYEDDNGNLYYKGHLDKEEYLYCVSADRNATEIAFGDQLVECKNSLIFAGEWKNTSDYVNMAVVYEYILGTDAYKLSVTNGTYILNVNNTRYELTYVSDTEYSYSDASNTYVVRINGNDYTLKINEEEFVPLTTTHVFKNATSNVEYKLIVESGVFTLYVGEDSYVLTGDSGVYEYKDTVNFMSYAVRYRNGKYQIKVTNEKVIIRQLYNSQGQLIYEEKYEKLAVNAQKYFYNTYYYMTGDSLVQYNIGASYDENNVYIITSIDLYFRGDGKYLLKSQDKSGNTAGRRTSSLIYDNAHSAFTVDNTAPSYNKSQNSPTGVNYWFSVPSQVITTQNIDYVNNITKSVNTDKSYNIKESGLNDNFFYAFATKDEAEKYLIEIYRNHINSMEDNTCTSGGSKGFSYSYYDPSMRSIETNCFVGKNGVTNKNEAQSQIGKIIKQLIYPTFSGATLFGDASIYQVACDSSVSSNCANNKDMFKVVYLKIDSTDPNNVSKNIVETCTETNKIACIKVNAKIIKNDSINGNSVSFELGSEYTIDTDSIVVYSKSTDSGSSTSRASYSASATITLNNSSYYIFEETDKTISYSNYVKGAATQATVNHFNTAYYAIYVDRNDFVDVYYDDGSFDYENGEISNSLTTTGIGTVKTNVDEYYLIIKNNGDSDFVNKYEIHTLTSNGVIVEVYSYLILKIDGTYYNINDYLVRNGNTYYFKIPMAKEKITNIEFIDRAGNMTSVQVSISKRAPSIAVIYNGEGGGQTVTLIVEDTELTKTNINSLEVLFSTDRSNYSTAKTANIRASLVCATGSTGQLYGCANTGSANGINSYRVVIANLEHLYGFFKVNLSDNNGNTNSLEFIYNPADMNANYTADMKFIDSSMDEENIRMTTNQQVQLEFNNQINYVILYKFDGSDYVEVCNTMNIIDGRCPGGNDLNKVSIAIDGEGQYLKSILTYTNEGLYKAKIFNRASEVINSVCFVDDGNGNMVVSEDCKKIQSQTSSICSWDNNPDYCDDSLEILTRDVSHSYVNIPYNVIEVDKTAPTINTNNFIVNLPTGAEPFANGATYTNAELTVAWEEDLVQLTYACEYIGSIEPCNGNSTGFMVPTKTYTFAITNRLNVKYEFWFEDYAGNSTSNNKYSFIVEIVLPEIAVYELDDNGVIIQDRQVVDGETINKNIQLLCYVEGANDNRCSTYDVKLEKFNGDGFIRLMLPDVTRVSETYGSQSTYKYTISIKNASTGYVYENLKTEFVFTIDKQAPSITVTGDLDTQWGIYRGEVRVAVSENGVGTIFAGCISTGVNEFGDKIYNCNENPIETFSPNTTLTKTGVYMIIAEDAVGNVTKDREIKYVSIDNEKPEISIKSKGQYLNYEISEKGFTNSDIVIVETSDNNEASYFKYRFKNESTNDQYSEWITHNSGMLEISEEGYYEVQAYDAVGNVGMERHFIIYRQAPKYTVVVGDEIMFGSGVVSEEFYIYWNEKPVNSYEAPIVKVTVNGRNYPNAIFGNNGKPTNAKEITMKDSGEYLFELTDLAGNVTVYKIAISKESDKICLNNVSIKPKTALLVGLDEETGKAGITGFNKYKFTEDDVIIIATSTYYFGGSSACGADSLNYRSLSDASYIVVGGYANYANSNGGLVVTLDAELTNTLKELGGFAVGIVVDVDVAKKDLGLPIGENFFTKDPLGWSLIFISGAAALYVGIRLVFFRKKVKVL